MQLEELQSLILSSSPEDWHSWGEEWSADDHHGNHATYRGDVALMLHWGRVDNEDFEEAWTKKFPDHHARSFWVEATYLGSRVFQELMVSTDGGRYKLPLPHARIIDEATKAVEYSVTLRQLALARLVQGLSGWAGYDIDQGMALADLVVQAG